MNATTNQFDLTGRRAIVTGASGGIGRAIAVEYARQGADVLAVARSADGLGETAVLAEGAPGAVTPFPADLREPEQIDAVVSRALADLGGIDVLVNNAAVSHASVLEETDLTTYRQVMDLNVQSSWLMCRAASAALADGDGGSVVNVASVLGLVGSAGESVYVAAKHALIGVTRGVALEWARRGVRVNALAPGYVATPMTLPYLDREDFSKSVLRQTPMNRVARPEEMTGPAVFLASRASAYMTGQVLVVDGGWTAK